LQRNSLCIVAIVVVSLVVLDHAPAAAAVSAVLTATTPSYTGNCPTTMAFTGTVSGAPGASFQYAFNRFINGTQQVVNIGAATLPASGILAVNDSMSIAATTGGNTFDQVWVHNIVGGQPDVYSAKANIKVTCGTPPPPTPVPTAIPGATKGIDLSNPAVDPDDVAGNPARPTKIATSGDPKVCAAHISNPFIAGLLCAPIAAANKLFIVWAWQPHPKCTSCPQDVDGFKIYQTDAGGTTLTYLSKSSAGVGATAGVLDLPAGGFVGKCYTVTAYKGSKESHPGYRTCIGVAPTLGTTTVTLQPAHERSSYKERSDKGLINSENTTVHAPDGASVGYAYNIEQRHPDHVDNFVYRAAVMFDLGPMAGRPLQKATLHLHVSSSMVAKYKQDNSKSCAAGLGTGQGAWWSNTDWIEGNWLDTFSQAGPNVDVDVTSEVRSWMNGAPNYGFVLKGTDENLNAFTDAECLSNYDLSLTVEYFK
jgi:hypothetical protein